MKCKRSNWQRSSPQNPIPASHKHRRQWTPDSADTARAGKQGAQPGAHATATSRPVLKEACLAKVPLVLAFSASFLLKRRSRSPTFSECPPTRTCSC
jgi:hypothetical protein